MKYKFYHIPAVAPEQAETDLNSFCSQHSVIKTDREFVADGMNSYWAICISYSDSPESPLKVKDKHKNRVDFKLLLKPDDFEVYSRLRALRKQLAEQNGTAVYNLFTNEQLSEMVLQRITNKEALGEVSGIGKAKLEKYGDQFIVRSV